MNTTKEKVSYCIGLETGRNLRHQFSDMDLTLLMQGFQDALSDGQPKLPQEEIQQILIALKQQVETQQRQFFAKVSEDNKRESEAFLTENKSKDGIVTLSSGLQYKVLQKSESADRPTALDVVKVHYRGSFIDGRVFDSTYQRGKPHIFPLNRVIPGWSEALQKMSVGEKWQIFIPPYLAYGENGFGAEIGPNVALVFELELLGINENATEE